MSEDDDEENMGEYQRKWRSRQRRWQRRRKTKYIRICPHITLGIVRCIDIRHMIDAGNKMKSVILMSVCVREESENKNGNDGKICQFC